MSAKRRPVQPPAGLQQRLDRSMNDGSLGGGIANAAPLVQGGRLRARSKGLVPSSSGSGGVQFWQDEFVVAAAGSQAVTLTYLPRPKSEHVYLNPFYQREGLDWTRSGQTVTLTADMDVRAGDIVTVEYAYLGAVPTPAAGVSPNVIRTATGRGATFSPVPSSDVLDGDLLVVMASADGATTVTAAGYSQVDGGFTVGFYGHQGLLLHRRQSGTTTHTLTSSIAQTSWAAVWLRNAGAFDSPAPASVGSLSVPARTLSPGALRLIGITFIMGGAPNILTAMGGGYTPVVEFDRDVNNEAGGAAIHSSPAGAADTVVLGGSNPNWRVFDAEILPA